MKSKIDMKLSSAIYKYIYFLKINHIFLNEYFKNNTNDKLYSYFISFKYCYNCNIIHVIYFLYENN